jgi:hypothetical protein
MMKTKEVQVAELRGIQKSRCIWERELFVAVP